MLSIFLSPLSPLEKNVVLGWVVQGELEKLNFHQRGWGRGWLKE